MRAYVRLDPNFPEHKADARIGDDYPDGALAAFVLTLCWAARQAPAGYFARQSVLGALLGRRARWIPFLLDHADVIELDDGRIHVEGWEEWQEGKFTRLDDRKNAIANRPKTDAERARAYRERKRQEQVASRDVQRDASRDVPHGVGLGVGVGHGVGVGVGLDSQDSSPDQAPKRGARENGGRGNPVDQRKSDHDGRLEATVAGRHA